MVAVFFDIKLNSFFNVIFARHRFCFYLFMYQLLSVACTMERFGPCARLGSGPGSGPWAALVRAQGRVGSRPRPDQAKAMHNRQASQAKADPDNPRLVRQDGKRSPYRDSTEAILGNLTLGPLAGFMINTHEICIWGEG